MLNIMKCITINLNTKNLLLSSGLVILAQTGYAAGEIDNTVQRQQQRDEALTKLVQLEPAVQTGLEKQLQNSVQLQYLKSHSEDICFEIKKFGGVLKSMLTLNEAIIDVKEG